MIAQLEFMPGSYVGRTRLGYSSGSPAHGLGTIDPNQLDELLTAGFSQGDLNTLDAMGASYAQFDELLNGTIDVPGLMQQLSSTQPTQPITAANMQLEPTDWASFGIEAALNNMGADLDTISQWTNASSAVANAVGGELGAEIDQYNSWVAQYQGYVNQANAPQILTMQDGTKVVVGPSYQAGAGTIITVAALSALAAAIVAYETSQIMTTKAKAQQVMATTGMAQTALTNASASQQNVATLQAQLNAAPPGSPQAVQLQQQIAALNAQIAQTLSVAQSGTGTPAPGALPAPTTGMWAWVQQNWQLSAAAVLLAVLVLKKK